MYSSWIVSSTVGVPNAPGGVADTNRLLLLKDGVGLLTAGGGPSGGFGCCGAGDMAWQEPVIWLLSLGRGSLGGVARRAASSELERWSWSKGGRALSLRPCSSLTPLELDEHSFFHFPLLQVYHCIKYLNIIPLDLMAGLPGMACMHVQVLQISKAESLQAALCSFIPVVRLLPVSPL